MKHYTIINANAGSWCCCCAVGADNEPHVDYYYTYDTKDND